MAVRPSSLIRTPPERPRATSTSPSSRSRIMALLTWLYGVAMASDIARDVISAASGEAPSSMTTRRQTSENALILM